MISHRVRVLTLVVLDVVPAVLWVRGLAAANNIFGNPATIAVDAAADPFQVRTGYAHANA